MNKSGRLSVVLFAVAALLTVAGVRGQDSRPVTVPLPDDLIISTRVPSVQIVGMTLALPGVSSATANVIDVEFFRQAVVQTNDVEISAMVRATMAITVTGDEILATHTNYTSTSDMSLGELTTAVYGIALHKLLDALPYAAAELMKP